jgi:predicted phosphodiesterase
MKKMISILAALLVMIIPVWAGGDQSKNDLRFNVNGKFKIVQFTDIHFQYDSYRSDSALVLMKMVIEKEKPDLVVLTGDVVCSKNSVKAWLALSQVLIDAKVPWAVTLGNHDTEYELTGKQIMETIEGLPYNLTANGPENLSGNGNYILEVHASKSDGTAALLYFLDSHSSFKPKGNLGTYEWVTSDQIAWYREQSNNFTKKNGGNPYPALAFFHIPLPEYKEIIEKKTTVGIQEETVCSPDLNSGLYTAMLESKDVMGMFVGHDHNNNYIGVLHNICLAYGNVTGRQCYGKIGRGARVIELYENTRKFDTWILKLYECDRDKDIWTPTHDDQRKFFVTYPDSFVEK